MAITWKNLDGQNVGVRLTGGSTSVNALSVDVVTGATSSPYLTASQLTFLQSAAQNLFDLVPAGERATVTFLTRLLTVAPADDQTLTLSASVAGSTATLVATVGGTPANLIFHVPHSVQGYNAWASALTGGGGPPPAPSNSTFTADCLAGDAVGACVYITGPTVAGVVQVATADPSDDSKMPAVGIITAKASATSCTVQRAAIADLTGSAVALTAGDQAWVGLSGLVVGVPPLASASGSGYVVLQPIGVATDAQGVEVSVGLPVLRDYA